MRTTSDAINYFFFILLFSPFGVANAQDAGGPYTSDANTILLMHFDGDLSEEASNYAVVNHGAAKSYIASPISGLGDAIYFDNSNPANRSYITVPYSAELSLTSNWTIEFWFTINAWDQSHNSWPVPILLPTAGWNANYYLEIPSTEGRLKYGFHSSDGGAQVYSSQNSITTGTWYHVALINDYDNNTIKLVLRDADFQKLEEPSASYTSGTTISTGTQDLRIGNGTAGDNAFNGYMDELRISNTVRDYSIQYDWETTSSDNFLFHYTNPDLYNNDLATSLENKFEDLDYTIWGISRNIYLLDRSQRINVFLYDADQPMANASAELRDWDVGYYTQSDIHIRVPSTERQLKYFPNFEKAAISVLARYVMAKKRTSVPSKGLSFGFGLFESGYSLDIDLIQNYLDANNNTFPNSSAFDTWVELDAEINVELAYTYVFASIFRHGYFTATVYDGLYNRERDVWYHIIRLFFLTDIEDGGMHKYYDGDDFIVYTNNQEVASLIVEGLQMYADRYEEIYGARINHPLLVTIYGSNEAYSFTEDGTGEGGGGGEALSHSLLRTSPPYTDPNLEPGLNRLLVKYFSLMGHEFMHNVFAFLAETEIPKFMSEGVAMYSEIFNLQGYNDINVGMFDYFHNFFWNDNNMYFPDLDNIFDIDGNFGYKMSSTGFAFVKENHSKETLNQFMKWPNNFSIIGYNDIDEFQKHLYETLYHQFMPSFLFNPNWNIETTFTPGSNYVFTWDGHYIDDLIIEYSMDGMNSWNYIADVSFSSGSYSWTIPNTANCVLRFSDSKYPEINFTYQIGGNKPTFDNVFNMTFENGFVNSVLNGNNGRLKGDVSIEARDGQNSSYAKFDGIWDVLSVRHYPDLSLNNNWTLQGDFMIENATGYMNSKPVILEKVSTNHGNVNYSISFNNNGLRHLRFEYGLQNSTVVRLEIDDAGITDGTWYTYYFARSVENNIAEARVYDQNGNILGSDIRQISGEGDLSKGAGDLYFGLGFFFTDKYLQGGLDNIIISDTYHDQLISNAAPVVSNAISDIELLVAEGDFVQDLSTVFADDDGDELSYSAKSSDDAVATVVVEYNTMTVMAVATGLATITITANDGRGGEVATYFVVTVPSGLAVERIDGEVPTEYALDQNYPNPFNPITTIQWALPEAGRVTLRIYNVQGVEIATLMDESFPPGRYSVSWDASDYASGVYLYRIEAGVYEETKALILVK